MSELTCGLMGWWDFWTTGGEALFVAHRAELDQESFPLVPDHELIEKLQDLDCCLLVAAHLDGVLSGYAVWYLSPSLESRGIMTAAMGPLFVAPQAREARVFLALWRQSMRELLARRVSQAWLHMASESPEGLRRFFASRAKERFVVFEMLMEKEPGE